jgi:hypothetical protein
MPATTPERQARWPGGDTQAMALLEGGGWVLGRDWVYRHPENRAPSVIEKDAAIYLIEEWDYGGLYCDPSDEEMTAECYEMLFDFAASEAKQ